MPSRKGRHLIFYVFLVPLDYVLRLFFIGGKMKTSACCFIGHRKAQDKELVFLAVKKTVERLIVENGIRTFHFGRKSEFDDLCHLAVTEIQSK